MTLTSCLAHLQAPEVRTLTLGHDLDLSRHSVVGDCQRSPVYEPVTFTTQVHPREPAPPTSARLWWTVPYGLTDAPVSLIAGVPEGDDPPTARRTPGKMVRKPVPACS